MYKKRDVGTSKADIALQKLPPGVKNKREFALLALTKLGAVFFVCGQF